MRRIGEIWKNKDGVLVRLNENHRVELYWPKNKIDALIRLYPNHTNVEIAEEIEMSVTAIRRKAKELHLRKDYSAFYALHRDIVLEGRRRSMKKPHGNIQKYIHEETEEQKMARLRKAADTRMNASIAKKLEFKKHMQDTMSRKTAEEMAQKARKVSDSWKDPEIRARRIEKLKETWSKKSKAEKLITAHLISVKKKEFFSNESEEDKRIRREKISNSLKNMYEKRRRAM